MSEILAGYIALRIIEWGITKMLYKFLNNG